MISFEEFKEIYHVVREVVSNLNENQKQIFLDRVGLSHENPTLKQISDKRNISRTRVNQIELLVLEKIYKTLSELDNKKK